MRNSVQIAGRRFALLAAVLALSAVTGRAATKGPDAGGYTGTDEVVFSFIDISGANGGVSLLGGTDDGTAPLNLPFAFQFYGKSYTIVCASSNGGVYFVLDASACGGFNDFANTDLSGTAPPNDLAAVFPLWTDLTFQVPGSGAVFYKTVGTAPGRKFVVQWNNAYPQGEANPVTFQVVFSEGTNKILFQYQTVGLGPGNPASNGGHATVGIRNSLALVSNEQTEWSFDAPVIGDQTALLFSPATASGVTPGRMTGSGATDVPGGRYLFQFEVREGATGADRGTLNLTVAKPGVTPGVFVAASFDQVTFSDDPAILQVSRGGKPAIVDTVIFSGAGRWNNAAGYTFTGQAVDAGEPGRGRDLFAITIRDSVGTVVATVSGPITDGNIQSSRIK